MTSSIFRYYVRDTWSEVLATDAGGRIPRGDVADLRHALEQGMDIKVAVCDLCTDLSREEPAIHHEVFGRLSSCFSYPDSHRVRGDASRRARAAGDTIMLPFPRMGLRMVDCAYGRLRGILAV